jgi:copper chaperone CopZ
MKKNNRLFKTTVAIAVAVFMVACGGQSNQKDEAASEAPSDVTVSYIEKVSDDGEKYSASLAIDGMACEMMCGSKISSALAGVEGVSNAEIEFNGAEEDNYAVVEFDGSQVSEQKMIEAVQALANGHYKVKSVEVTHFMAPDGSNVNSDIEEEEDAEVVGMVKPKLEYQLPNVFSALARLF